MIELNLHTAEGNGHYRIGADGVGAATVLATYTPRHKWKVQVLYTTANDPDALDAMIAAFKQSEGMD